MELYLPPVIKEVPLKKGNRFTNEEIRQIAMLYPYNSNTEIARIFGRTEHSILGLRQRYGWYKSPEYMTTGPGRFKKGITPANKGKKMKSGPNRTSFVKGVTPHNILPVGTIVQRHHKRDKKTYRLIKRADGKWEFLSRHIYRQHFGEIPKGMIVALKDGNHDNLEPENLMLITRDENRIRNHNRSKAGKTIAETWKREKLRVKYGMKQKTKLRIRT